MKVSIIAESKLFGEYLSYISDNVVDISCLNNETGDIILRGTKDFLKGCDKIINQIPLINIEYFDNYENFIKSEQFIYLNNMEYIIGYEVIDKNYRFSKIKRKIKHLKGSYAKFFEYINSNGRKSEKIIKIENEKRFIEHFNHILLNQKLPNQENESIINLLNSRRIRFNPRDNKWYSMNNVEISNNLEQIIKQLWNQSSMLNLNLIFSIIEY